MIFSASIPFNITHNTFSNRRPEICTNNNDMKRINAFISALEQSIAAVETPAKKKAAPKKAAKKTEE